MVIIGCWKRCDIRGFFHYFSVAEHDIHVTFANAIYLGVMRFISVEKFQRVMSYAQVVLIAGVALSYQLVGQITRSVQLDMFHPGTWMYFTPPCYFMSLTVMGKQPTGPVLLLALIGVGLLSYLVISRWLILHPIFRRRQGR